MRWEAAQPVALASVVATFQSAPRAPGAAMLVGPGGAAVGSVSGGCIEDDLISRVKRGELASRLPQTTTYGVTAAEAQRFGLPCGGTVQVVLEPLSAGSLLRELLAAIESHRVVRRRLELGTGGVSLAPSEDLLLATRHLWAPDANYVAFRDATGLAIYFPTSSMPASCIASRP